MRRPETGTAVTASAALPAGLVFTIIDLVNDTQLTPLKPYPCSRPYPRVELGVAVSCAASRLSYRFILKGLDRVAQSALEIPPLKPQTVRLRRDELWKHTCLELFFGPSDAKSYFELNLSPSGDWNLYAFDDYRSGMRPAPTYSAPTMGLSESPSGFVWSGELDLTPLAGGDLVLGATAVLEYSDGAREYWALDHCGDKPDFHLRESFQIRIQG